MRRYDYFLILSQHRVKPFAYLEMPYVHYSKRKVGVKLNRQNTLRETRERDVKTTRSYVEIEQA